MSSSQDIRCSIILENLPKLIENLTGLKPSDVKFTSHEHWALGRIRNHKFLSVNGHEVQRRLTNLGERIHIANHEPYAERLDQLCQTLRTNTLCTEHYETDIHWSVMSFLLHVASNPVAGLALNRGRISLHDRVEETPELMPNPDAIVMELLADNFIAAGCEDDGVDELSDWSDSSSDDANVNNTPTDVVAVIDTDAVHNQDSAKMCSLPGIKPPANPDYYETFDGNESNSWLTKNAQCAWWLNDSHVQPSLSRHPQSQFCHTVQRLSATTDAPAAVTTLSEYCLIREILWLFSEPVTCKTFTVDHQRAVIRVATNVSLNSTSPAALRASLEHFTRYATLCLRLNTFCAFVTGAVGDGQNTPVASPPPHSYECYAHAVRQCMRPFRDFLGRTERTVAAQRPDVARPQTLVCLQRDMEPYTQLLDNLYDVHTSATLDFEQKPAHICAAHLIGGLLRAHEMSSSTCHANIAAALLMASLRVYMGIIETWWTDGRLEDWRQEFVIATVSQQTTIDGRSPDHTNDFEMRSFEIDSCPLLKMLCSHSMQAGYTLNVLHTLDRIGEMKSLCGYQENLFETFWKNTLEKLQKLQLPTNIDTKAVASPSIKPSTTQPVNERLQQIEQFRQQVRCVGSQHLLALVFDNCLSQMETNAIADKSNSADANADEEPVLIDDAYALYTKFESMSADCILPIGDIIRETLATMLTARIAVANRFVIGMYRDEFQVLSHLHNLRRIYLLEASDLMFQFYTGLFRDIEQSDSWNNSYLLTDQLNGLLCSKYTDMSGLFAVHVSGRKFVARNVLDAIRNVSIQYAVAPCMRDIICEASVRTYNEVLRLLLRIKWGLWCLEQLRFPLGQRRRRTYARQTYSDRMFKRLAMVRIWILYSMQCVHNHVMTYVVRVMGDRLDAQVAACRTLAELGEVHRVYLRAVHGHCFLQRDDRHILMAVEQLLTLICVVRNEWCDLESEDAVDGVRNSQIDEIESSYINCHAYITGVLNTQLYTNNRAYLSSLAASFSCSRPY